MRRKSVKVVLDRKKVAREEDHIGFENEITYWNLEVGRR